jgi:uncharacterized LabA/DUF88 family protein
MSVDRVGIFIDAGYIDKILEKEFARTPIDYGKLVAELQAGKELLRTYYYNCPPYQGNPPSPDEARRKAGADSFYAQLRKLPRFEVRLGRLTKRSCKKCGDTVFQQKRADLMLGVDLANMSARAAISKAVLVAGDSDLIPAVQVAKECGVLVHLYHGITPHRDLWDLCDDRTAFTKAFIEKIKR